MRVNTNMLGIVYWYTGNMLVDLFMSGFSRDSSPWTELNWFIVSNKRTFKVFFPCNY